jgi:hypothetical protein
MSIVEGYLNSMNNLFPDPRRTARNKIIENRVKMYTPLIINKMLNGRKLNSLSKNEREKLVKNAENAARRMSKSNFDGGRRTRRFRRTKKN